MKNLIKLISSKELAVGTRAFFFEKPAGFNHRPGQYLTFTLIKPAQTDEEGNSRDFSIVSAPHEGLLEMAIRMRDTAFKRVLGDLPLGSEIEISGPFGSFTLHSDPLRPAVFLVGGIGITPFISMIRHVLNGGATRALILIYSNRRKKDAAYFDELEALTKEHSSFKFIPTMTDENEVEEGWRGEQGYITEEMLKRNVPDIHASVFYSAGPPQMVAAIWQLLMKMGVSEDNIRTEEFAGY